MKKKHTSKPAQKNGSSSQPENSLPQNFVSLGEHR